MTLFKLRKGRYGEESYGLSSDEKYMFDISVFVIGHLSIMYQSITERRENFTATSRSEDISSGTI